MTVTDTPRFLIPEGLPIDELIAGLGRLFRLGEDDPLEQRLTFHDTFDARLYLGGLTLCEAIDPEGARLVCEPHGKNGDAMVRRIEGEMPAFAGDLPADGMRERLGGLLEMRRLLPQVELRGRLRTLRLLDDEEKTLLRVEIEELQAKVPGGGGGRELPPRLCLRPVRGYTRPFEQVLSYLRDTPGYEPLQRDRYEEALDAIGRGPADYDHKLNFHFVPGMPTEEAVREIHLFLLGVLEANIPGVRDDLDSEFLHDLRVAVRRARSALTQIREVFPGPLVERFKERFAWIGQITGPTRDLDVYLLGFDDYLGSVPEEYRAALGPLRAFLVAHQRAAQRELVGLLDSPPFASLLQEWRGLLERPLATDPAPRFARTPVLEVANRRISRMYKRVLKEGLAITAASPAEEMHELRKSCKKLRYLMEFFQSLYPSEEIKPSIKALKRLLDNLGAFQDLHVQAETLRGFAHRMEQEGAVPPDTLLAMGMLVDGLLRRQQAAHDEFAGRFSEFATHENQAHFRSLFAPHQGGKGG